MGVRGIRWIGNVRSCRNVNGAGGAKDIGRRRTNSGSQGKIVFLESTRLKGDLHSPSRVCVGIDYVRTAQDRPWYSGLEGRKDSAGVRHCIQLE
jgi:hypothetical protein